MENTINDTLNLIVMLTHHDKTVNNALEVFEKSKNSKARIWGMKEEPLSVFEMKNIFARMKACGKITVLETVAYTEHQCMEGAKKAVECGCDILMGTKFFDSVNQFCAQHHLKYMPFVGEVSERPSVLSGSVESIIAEAKMCISKGVYGIDLLSYRYVGDIEELNRRFLSEIHAPVCIAGSIHSFERLDALKAVKPWAFTIGGAFFENKFGDDFETQINTVYDDVNHLGGRDV